MSEHLVRQLIFSGIFEMDLTLQCLSGYDSARETTLNNNFCQYKAWYPYMCL